MATKLEKQMAELLRDADDFLTDGDDFPQYVDDPVHSWALKAREVYKPVLHPKRAKSTKASRKKTGKSLRSRR